MRRNFATAIMGFASACGLGACSTAPATAKPPTRSCDTVVWYKPVTSDVHPELIGDFNGWNHPGVAMTAQPEGWLAASLTLTPGEHLYAIDVDGTWLTDDNVGTTAYYEGSEVTWIDAADCSIPALSVTDTAAFLDGHADIAAAFLAASSGDPIDPTTLTATDRDGTALTIATASIDAPHGTIAATVTGLAPGKHTITLAASDTKGRAAEAAIATAWVEANVFDWRDAVIYQIMVDRYRNESGALEEPATPASRAGGNVDGVRNAIESGELAALGVNTIWISPLYQNPADDWPGGDGRMYSGYHGYWPTGSRTLEASQATNDSLAAMIASAHAQSMRVLFDVVPNHVHLENPYVAHMNDGWFNHPDGKCVCGMPNCDWDTHIIDCWFNAYLPDLAWGDSTLATQATSDVAWWLDSFDADGIRIDAIPMMPRSANRRIVQQLRAKFDNPAHRTFILGENFTTDYAALRYDLGPFGLDSEFDFPLMWTLRSVVAQNSGSMADIDTAMHDGMSAWGDANAIMSMMLDNHDVSRFSSVSAGDDGGDTWTPAPQSTDPVVYAKQLLALSALFTLPGAPILYYGDEIALAGKSDPDSRRIMPAESALTALQTQTRTQVRALGKLRACSTALRRGGYRTLASGSEYLVYARETDSGDDAIVVLERQPTADVRVPLPGIAAGTYVDALTGDTAALDPELTTFARASFSARVFLPAASACVATSR